MRYFHHNHWTAPVEFISSPNPGPLTTPNALCPSLTSSFSASIAHDRSHPLTTHHGILWHVIFSTKYRKRYLAESWRDELFAYISGIVTDHKAVLLKGGGIEDHIHLLLRVHPEFAISKTVQMLKANSSRWINQ